MPAPSRRRVLNLLLAVLFTVGAAWLTSAAFGSSTRNGFGPLPRELASRPPAAAHAGRARAARLTRELRALESQRARRPQSVSRRRLVRLSHRRLRAVRALLARHPDAAGRLILAASTRRTLHRIRGAAVESKATVSGVYRLEDRDRPSPGEFSQVVSPNGRHIVTLAGTLPRLTPGERVSVRGYRLGNTLLVSKSHVLFGAASSSTTVGQVNVAVIVANFSDSTTSPDLNAIETTFDGSPGNDAASYFSQSSYGKMTLAPSFYGPYTLPVTASVGCSGNENPALLAAAASDVTFSRFSRLIFVYNCPGTSEGSATSVGPVSTPQGTVDAAQIAMDSGSAATLYSVVHEISHTLGPFLKHAAFYVCTPEPFIAPTRFGAGCASNEYGNSFDVLGGGSMGAVSQLDAYHKAQAGWFDPGQDRRSARRGHTRTRLLPTSRLPQTGSRSR